MERERDEPESCVREERMLPTFCRAKLEAGAQACIRHHGKEEDLVHIRLYFRSLPWLKMLSSYSLYKIRALYHGHSDYYDIERCKRLGNHCKTLTRL